MPVWGPRGTAEHLVRAYGNAEQETISGVLEVHELVDRQPLTIGPFTVTPFRVLHPVTAFGFRVEAGGRVLAYTGDTDTCESLTPLLSGADLVLADSAFVDGRDEPRGVHLSGSRAAQAAVDAGGVGRLMLTHIPAWNDPLVCRAQAAEVWPGVVEMAEPDRTYAVERAPVPQ
jgi:ribonuclease BN (tRNA processing enzyme)